MNGLNCESRGWTEKTELSLIQIWFLTCILYIRDDFNLRKDLYLNILWDCNRRLELSKMVKIPFFFLNSLRNNAEGQKK